MKSLLQQLFNHHTLDYQTAKDTLINISKGDYNNSQITSFLTVFRMRSITLEEIRGFRDALLELCRAIDLSEFNAVDLCGTGGDGKDTFNVSTLASFVTAGAGVKVAKHGNYGVSSSCGSSNVIEHLGYQFTNDADKLKKQIDKANICFLHAPLFHPAMKNVAPIRKEMGVKTFFNMLGPMVNPSFPKNQIVGVFSLELQRLYQYLYQQSGKRFVILHALDGYDEISLTGKVKVITNESETIRRPEDFGMNQVKQSDLYGGTTVPEAATIFMNILTNKGTTVQQQVVATNAGMAISCSRPDLNLKDSIALAKESLESGKALKSFETLIATT
ncbi:MAG: anthranilate phosphoribosyltransferase [Patescibacteria group bacterium]|jgi:anthranilate phosphoribosyltransferase